MTPAGPDDGRLDDGRLDDGGEELGSAAGWPRWAIRVAAGVAAAAVLALAVVAVASREHRRARAEPRPAAHRAATPLRTVGEAAALALPPRSRPEDVLAADGTVWVLTARALLRSTAAGWVRRSLAPAPGPAARRRLLFDPDTLTLWVVGFGARPALVRAFAALTLRPVGSSRWPRRVVAAVPVRGSLYVADTTGLFRLTTYGARTRIDVPWGRQVLSLVADQRRDRTLALIGPRSHLRLGVLGEIEPFVPVNTPPGVRDAMLGVTGDGQTWLAAAGASGAVLDRLNPRTLEPAAASALATQLGSRAVLRADGTSSVLVTGTGPRASLWCIGPAGSPALRWQLDAARAAATTGVAVAVVGGAAFRLALAATCPG